LLDRHEVLRTVFEVVDGRPVQRIAEHLEVEAPLVDLGGDAEMLPDLLAREAARPFDLSHGPLVRLNVFRVSDLEYVLLLNMHHIVTDAWSGGVLLDDLFALYTQFRRGRLNVAPGPALQYVDYAAWQRRTLDQHALEADLDYWRSALMGAPPVLDISLTGRSPSGGPHTGRSRSFAISSDVMTELRGIARGQNATLFATLLAAFSVLLYRLTGRTDIVVGAPVANRHPPETESIVGFFVNTLPLRVTVEPHSPFRAHVRRAQNVSLDGLAHQQAPFEKIVEALAPEHSLSYAPIFQVLFGVRDAQAPPAVDGLSVQSLDVHSGTSKFDLNMELLDTGETLEGSVEFDTSLFSPEMVDNLLTAWTQLLSAIAANPDAQPGEVELLDAHLRQTFNSYMRGPVEPPGSDTVLSLFRSQVERSPDAPAVQSGATSLTYRQLNERANQVAHRLIDLGAGPERTVALCVRRSPEMVVAVLAAMKTGAAYVPLDPAYPTERLESMLTQSAPAALLASPELAPRFAHLGVKTMLVEPGETLAADIRVDDPEVSIAPDNLAYILFTSGSTGQPKGVQLPHRALVNLLEWHARHTPPTARTLQFASLGFDLSFHEIFSALIAGACVYVVSDEERRELPRLPRLIAERQVDKVMLSAGMLQEIARSYEEQSGPRLPVKVLASTAEQLKITPALQRFVQNLGDVVLRNDYGPTETHVATSAILSVHGELAQGEPPIGRPLDNCRAYVLDHLGNPVVPGYAGELYLAGACLARGYHLHPDLTAERFLPDPLGDQPGERMYRTGDLVRCDADGNLFYLGRIDRQLKIRGMRVEPAEIEAVLHTVPGIDEALVIPTEVAGGSTQLVAYLATHLESEAAISAAQRAVAEQLPDYMRPSAWACLPAFPLTPNGKINRSDLPPAASVGSVVPEHDDERPRTDIEQRLCRIWGEVLELEQVGIRSSFFSLGGHSLRMIQIASRVRSEFGVEISMQSFFEGPTIAEQAVVVTSELALRRSPDSVDALLDQVANLPEDQVQSLLAGIQAGVTGAMVDAVVKGTAAVANMAVNIGQVTADASVNFAMASTAHFQSRAERLADLLTRSANQPSSSARISAIGVPSSNRPASLAECLTSYAGNLQEFDRRVDVVVCSDPQDAAMDREYREVLQRLQKQTGLRCWYAGVEDKRAYAERLSRRADVPQELAEFALFGDHRQGTTYGANRNALLLHHAGVAFLSVDDDTSAQLHDPPTPASPVGGIDFCSEDGVSEVRVVVDRNEALALVRPTHVDVVEMHETVLGARVPDVFARTAHGQLPGLDRLDAAVDASILNGRVVASYNGWLGFSGWRSPVDALFLEGASWRWLTRSEDAYMRSLNSTEQVRFVPRLTITRSPEFFVVSGAFDVRSLLPPFIPVYRREDIMFGLLLKRSSDEACFAHLPAMVTHGTPRSRFSLAREAFDFADLIDAGSAGWTAPSEATVSHRLEQLGRHLEDIGRLDSHDFENWIDTAVRPRVLAHLDEIEQRVMACPPERDFWARDMRHLLNVSRRSIAARGLKPLGSTQRSGENAWAPFQDTLARAGQLIAHWPAMLSEARALRQQEIFLAQPVVA
jgi:amino acid adenylation domain-containing protein